MSNIQEDFEVIVTDIPQESTKIITISELFAEKLEHAARYYDPANKSMSVYLNDTSTSEELTTDLIDILGNKPQSDISKIIKINSIVEKMINTDDIIGKVDESIETNINTEYKLSYSSTYDENTDDLNEVKEIINNVNESINIEDLIRTSIPSTYRSGNYILYLRHDKNVNYTIDVYPLGIALISTYHIGNDPYILIDINKLTSGLRKNYSKNKKKKPLFYSNIEEEIQATYPNEVYEAYKKKEQYAKLDIKYSYVLRVGHMNKQYGLTPIFRALKPAIMLQTFDNSDRITSKSRSKKIIAQFMNKEFAGQDYKKDCYDLQAYNHENLCNAFKCQTVLTTLNPSVRDIKYVESNTNFTDKDTVNTYRNRVYSSLGIGFLMESSSSVSTANIALGQLMKTINKIGEQLEKGIEKFYRQILIDNGKDPILTPKIHIIDSEQLEQDMKIALAQFMYGTLGASLETCYNTVGLSIEDEAIKRKAEKESGYEKLFSPHSTAFTKSGDSSINSIGGNPRESTDESKESYDENYNKNR